MEGVAAPTSEDSLEREAQGGAKRYVSRHQMSPNAWSSPTLRPSAEAEFISSASVLSPHNFSAADSLKPLTKLHRLSAVAGFHR